MSSVLVIPKSTITSHSGHVSSHVSRRNVWGHVQTLEQSMFCSFGVTGELAILACVSLTHPSVSLMVGMSGGSLFRHPFWSWHVSGSARKAQWGLLLSGTARARWTLLRTRSSHTGLLPRRGTAGEDPTSGTIRCVDGPPDVVDDVSSRLFRSYGYSA
jgi:hypothetical protein